MNNLKRLLPVVLVLILVGFLAGYLLGKGSNEPEPTPIDDPITIVTPTTDPTNQNNNNNNNTQIQLSEDGQYNSKEEVALYIHLYGHLPDNYVTKSEARNKGWSGGSLESYFPGCSIGGDSFGNREGLLPSKKGRRYYECDIDTAGKKSRGEKRIVYSNDGLVYYSDDHYESFELLYGEE